MPVKNMKTAQNRFFIFFFSLPGSLMDILQIANDTVKLFNVIQLLGDDVIDAFTKLMRRSTISTFMDLESSFRIKNMFIRTMLQGFNENMATLKRRVADLERKREPNLMCKDYFTYICHRFAFVGFLIQYQKSQYQKSLQK